jgi:hypothetical protein
MAQGYQDRLREIRAKVVQNKKPVPMWKVTVSGEEIPVKEVIEKKSPAKVRASRKLEAFNKEYQRLHAEVPMAPTDVFHKVIGDTVAFFTDNGQTLVKKLPLSDFYALAERNNSYVKGQLNIQPFLEVVGKNIKEDMLLHPDKFALPKVGSADITPTYRNTLTGTAGQGSEFGKWGSGKLFNVSQLATLVPELANMLLDPNYMKQNMSRGQLIRTMDPTVQGVI